MNTLFIVLDAVGYDVFMEAMKEKVAGVKKVYSSSCWTLPSFVSYMWSYPPLGLKRIFDWDPPKWAPTEFQDRGYETAFFSGNPFNLMSKSFMSKGFDIFEDFVEKNSVDEMINRSLQEIRGVQPRSTQPVFFHVLHVMETHIPYFDGKTEFPKIYEYSPQTIGNIDMQKAMQHQVKSVQYVAEKLKLLFDSVPRPTKVILTADHGEVFLPGAIGHAPNKVPFDVKLFEIPYVEWVIE